MERRYRGKLCKEAIDMMARLLKMDPTERLTTKEAINHSYFDLLPNHLKELNQNEMSPNEKINKQQSQITLSNEKKGGK